MKIDQRLEQHFPTPVLVRDHEDIDALTAALKALMEEVRLSEANAA